MAWQVVLIETTPNCTPHKSNTLGRFHKTRQGLKWWLIYCFAQLDEYFMFELLLHGIHYIICDQNFDSYTDSGRCMGLHWNPIRVHVLHQINKWTGGRYFTQDGVMFKLIWLTSSRKYDCTCTLRTNHIKSILNIWYCIVVTDG